MTSVCGKVEHHCSIAGLGFNVVADPIVGYFYKMYILGQPQQMAEVLAKWSTATTFVNAVVSVILVSVLYNAVRPILLRSGLMAGTSGMRGQQRRYDRQI